MLRFIEMALAVDNKIVDEVSFLSQGNEWHRLAAPKS